MRFPRLTVLSAVLAILASACESSSPSAPVVPNVAGTWTGTVNDAVTGQGTVRLTITQSGSSLAGTWATTYAIVSKNNSGSLTGTATSTNVTATLIPTSPTACPFTAVASRNGNAMSGTYATFNCAMAVSGSINVSKQ